jgi:hypothetical protein
MTKTWQKTTNPEDNTIWLSFYFLHRSVQDPFLTPPCPMQWQNLSKHDISKCLNKANLSPKRGFTDLFSMFKTLFLPHHVQCNGKIPPSMTFQNVSTKLIPLQRGGVLFTDLFSMFKTLFLPHHFQSNGKIPPSMTFQNVSRKLVPLQRGGLVLHFLELFCW